MNRDEIIRMAREAGYGDALSMLHSNALERFATLVAAAEREACATVADELGEYWSAYKDTALLNGDIDLSNAASGEPRAAEAIAAAIRARGQK